MIFHILFLLHWCVSVNTHYILYHSNSRENSFSTSDCLYAYFVESGKETAKPYLQNSQLVPYCQRPDDDQVEILSSIEENIAKKFTFKELKQNNITSAQLLQWFAPINIAEKYQMNLNDSNVFHNCTSPWFGSHCQYKFISNSSLSFTDIVRANILNQNGNITTGACYRFLNGCNGDLWPLCLDWREICDGKINCLNGEDEQWCNELELNECHQNEYRCHYGGQCIPLSFLKDSTLSIDCLDGSDERDYRQTKGPLMNAYCFDITTFRCEERIGRYLWSFPCGDGQYLISSSLPSYQSFCRNKKEIKFSRALVTSMDHISNINCQKSFYCALHFNRTYRSSLSKIPDTIFYPIIENVWNEECEPLSKHCLSERVRLPKHPILFGIFQFIYFTNRSVEEFKKSIAPDLICFHRQACPMLFLKIIPLEIINGLICFDPMNLTDGSPMKNFDDIHMIFRGFNQRCFRIGIEKSCLNSSYFHCNQSMKCIPYHRVGDGQSDCDYSEDELVDTCQFNDSNRYRCQQNFNVCLKQVTIGDGFRNCPSNEDEAFTYAEKMETLVSFPDICNQYWNTDLNLFPVNETDETNCHWWPCDNPYTHCNEIFNCLNGIDELNCPNRNCEFDEHQCQIKDSKIFYCLPIDQIYEKYLDQTNETYPLRQIYFHNKTIDINNQYFPWNNNQCIAADRITKIDQKLLTKQNKCLYPKESIFLMYLTTIKSFSNDEDLCEFKFSSPHFSNQMVYFFKTSRLGYFPSLSINRSIPLITKTDQKDPIIDFIDPTLISYCHRGIPVFTGRNETIKWFCPPNYFGSQCQWQNQRISLTLQFVCRDTTSVCIICQVVIMLIDDEGKISPYSEQITYVPTRDCNTKFNIYLLHNNQQSLSDLSHY